MGIEQFDFLYKQTRAILEYMNAIKASLNTTLENIALFQKSLTTTDDRLRNFNDNIDTAIAYITAADYTNALTVLEATKKEVAGIRTGVGITNAAVSSMSDVVSKVSENTNDATTLTSSLIPRITAEVEKCYDGKTTYNYMCKVCSIKCKIPLKFIPLNEKALTYCFLKNDNSAEFIENDRVHVE